MEIVKERSGDFLHVRVTGRLDNHWSQPLEDAIDEMIREGAHHLRLDLSGVNYLSSAGVGALMKAYRDTNELNGSCLITEASERVRTVLRLVDLESLLFASSATERKPPRIRTIERPLPIESERAVFECHSLDLTPSEVEWIGDPRALSQKPQTSSAIEAKRDVFALGVGALGQSYDECRTLFGEFIAAGGTAAYMPTDGTSTPDYMTSTGAYVPEIQALYAIVFRGLPAYLLRFEASTPGVAIPLGEIVSVAGEFAGTTEFGLVMCAEVAGLVCASLRQSPAHDVAQFDFPAIREWLSFSPEREHARTSSIVVGYATASESAFLRRVNEASFGHFHAAITAFRSLPRGKVAMADVLAQAFQPHSVISVVHLLRDDRPIEGAGESEFLRGACWVFPRSEA